MVLAMVTMTIEIIVGYRGYSLINVITPELLYSTIVGCAVYILGIIVVFPTTASVSLEVNSSQGWEINFKGELLVTLDNCVNLLRSCIEKFKTGEKSGNLKVLLANFSKLSWLLSDTKLEINYGYLSSKDFATITKSVKQLIQHLGSMDSVEFPIETLELRKKVVGRKFLGKIL
jgi:hypothetical protein